jgi:hypothetical protein
MAILSVPVEIPAIALSPARHKSLRCLHLNWDTVEWSESLAIEKPTNELEGDLKVLTSRPKTVMSVRIESLRREVDVTAERDALHSDAKRRVRCNREQCPVMKTVVTHKSGPRRGKRAF